MVQVHTMPHFKDLDMKNLQYEKRMCPKDHTKVTVKMSIECQSLLSILSFLGIHLLPVLNSVSTLCIT